MAQRASLRDTALGRGRSIKPSSAVADDPDCLAGIHVPPPGGQDWDPWYWVDLVASEASGSDVLLDTIPDEFLDVKFLWTRDSAKGELTHLDVTFEAKAPNELYAGKVAYQDMDYQSPPDDPRNRYFDFDSHFRYVARIEFEGGAKREYRRESKTPKLWFDFEVTPAKVTLFVWTAGMIYGPDPQAPDPATGCGGQQPYYYLVKLVAPQVRILIDGVDPQERETTGGLVVKNFDDNGAPRKRITLERVSGATYNGNVVLAWSEEVAVYKESEEGTPLLQDSSENAFAYDQLPLELWVEGLKESGTMRDVELTADFDDPEQRVDRVTFTVLWCKKPELKGQPTDAVSGDNKKRSFYIQLAMDGQGSLGPKFFFVAEDDIKYSWAFEAGSEVQPSDFKYPSTESFKVSLFLDRDAASRGYERIGATGDPTEMLDPDFRRDFKDDWPGSDSYVGTSLPPLLRDDDPSPNGKIYDIDVPGPQVAPPLGGKVPTGTTFWVRFNFRECALVELGQGNYVRASEVAEHFLRFAIRKNAQINSWSPDNTLEGDNAFGDVADGGFPSIALDFNKAP